MQRNEITGSVPKRDTYQGSRSGVMRCGWCIWSERRTPSYHGPQAPCWVLRPVTISTTPHVVNTSTVWGLLNPRILRSGVSLSPHKWIPSSKSSAFRWRPHVISFYPNIIGNLLQNWFPHHVGNAQNSLWEGSGSSSCIVPNTYVLYIHLPFKQFVILPKDFDTNPPP